MDRARTLRRCLVGISIGAAVVLSGCANASGHAEDADASATDATASADESFGSDASPDAEEGAAPDGVVDSADQELPIGPPGTRVELPYQALVYHLDLSIFAYQLYTQSLVWPFDPYYEELAPSSQRDAFMDAVRAWARQTGAAQVAASLGLQAVRGPGVLAGFDDNPAHDPVIYQYSRLHPWSASIVNPAGRWSEYLTPSSITDPIREVTVCSRVAGQPEGTVRLDALPSGRHDVAPGARDILLAIEGGTGDKGNVGQPASQSLMAFVVVRVFGDAGPFDVHIAFRGSRSGSAFQAAIDALSGDHPKGNPDWITDLGYDPISARVITTTGSVHSGVARSMQSTFPQLLACLAQAPGIPRGLPPERIYVTGHSLGGGLAQHFASGLLLGDVYGPGGGGEAVPEPLRTWPWRQLKLITFGAPRVGDEGWAVALATALDTQYFAPGGYDWTQALGAADPEILARLDDPTRPAAYRVLVPTDPISSPTPVGGAHVGRTVYVEPPSFLALPELAAHEPTRIRQALLEVFADPTIPDTAWRFHEMSELVPDRDASHAGSLAEYEKLSAAVVRYYADSGLWFDRAAFDASLQTFWQLLARL